jgi:hypothetical protein
MHLNLYKTFNMQLHLQVRTNLQIHQVLLNILHISRHIK